MTYSEEIQQNMDSGESSEPTGFFEVGGIQATSTVLAGLLVLLGIGGAGALWWYKVKPAWEQNATIESELQTQQSALQQQQAADNSGKLTALEQQLTQEKRIASDVLNSYGKEKQIQTFLLDLNRILTASNIQLVSYEPTPSKPEFIEDVTYGETAQNRLQSQTFNVEFEDMTYSQVESMLENLDLLQPLIVLRNFSTSVAQKPTYLYDNNELILQNPTKLGVSFVVDALIAPTPEELAEVKKKEAEAEAEAAKAASPETAPAEEAPQ